MVCGRLPEGVTRGGDEGPTLPVTLPFPIENDNNYSNVKAISRKPDTLFGFVGSVIDHRTK